MPRRMRKQNEGLQYLKVHGQRPLGYLESAGRCRLFACHCDQCVLIVYEKELDFNSNLTMEVAKLVDLWKKFKFFTDNKIIRYILIRIRTKVFLSFCLSCK